MDGKLVCVGEGGRSAGEINKQWKPETFCKTVGKNTPGEIILQL